MGAHKANILDIIKLPDPMLRKTAIAVPEVTDGIRNLLDDMAVTMYDAPGIGLAAPQINISERLISSGVPQEIY